MGAADHARPPDVSQNHHHRSIPSGSTPRVQDDLKVKFHNEKGDIVFAPAAIRVSGKLSLDKTIFGEDFLVSQIHDNAHGKAHHSLAQHGSLSQRARGHR